jgi:pyrroloquinoline quinone biosynthesis protein B
MNMKHNKSIRYAVIAMTACFILLNVVFSYALLPKNNSMTDTSPFIIVLGTAQDGGYPHAGCRKACCARYYEGSEKRHYVSCLALVDPVSGQRWLFDCTPDFTMQLHMLDSIFPTQDIGISGIFLTHAHIGHYAGLMYLGREAMNTQGIPVYAMPRMKDFLSTNGPWSQLVARRNIDIRSLAKDSTIHLNDRITVTPFRVPHRDEFSETVGYRIATQRAHVIFIPDIDKWDKWDQDLATVVRENDLVLIDGTFFKDGELQGVSMKDVPHPFIEETMQRLSSLPDRDKQKVHFIHLNHTNPALLHDQAAIDEIGGMHFRVAKEQERYGL